jgi:hypothetical protein
MRPDRIVVGCDEDDDFARDLMRRLYHPLSLNQDRLVFMAPASAELTKYVANTMLAMRISFMNEIAMLCEKVGADVNDVRMGVGSDSRIGTKFLYAGPGYGGSCFPKDVSALVHVAREHSVPLELAAATDQVNQRQKGVLLRKLRQHFDGDLRGKKIGIWGIAFKPRTDDIRDAPSRPRSPHGGPCPLRRYGDHRGRAIRRRAGRRRAGAGDRVAPIPEPGLRPHQASHAPPFPARRPQHLAQLRPTQSRLRVQRHWREG